MYVRWTEAHLENSVAAATRSAGDDHGSVVDEQFPTDPRYQPAQQGHYKRGRQEQQVVHPSRRFLPLTVPPGGQADDKYQKPESRDMYSLLSAEKKTMKRDEMAMYNVRRRDPK